MSLVVNHVTVNFEGQAFQWDFTVNQGEFLAVVGDSGVGKSTLLKTLLGLHTIASGSIHWHDQELSGLKPSDRPFGILFQQDNVFEHLSVEKNLAFGLSASGQLTAEQQTLLASAAERFQLGALLQRRASDLSGGQQQRVALARVFLQRKPVLLLDEPFSSLDPTLRLEGLQWVTELQKESGLSVIMVTHHLDEISDTVDAVLAAQGPLEWSVTRYR